MRFIFFYDDEPTFKSFRRGDCNDDSNIGIADAACILDWLFQDPPEPGCLAATNTNGVNVSDVVWLLNYLLASGPSPVEPFANCGPGTLAVDDEFGCETTPQECQR